MIDSPENEVREPTLSQNRRVLSAAALLAAGNVIQRLLGMAREIVKANLFGASGTLSAFNLAALVPNTLYQLVAGGEMVTSSLVPIFSDYASRARRDELWAAFSSFLSLVVIVLSILVLVVELFTPQIALLVGAGNLDDPTLLPLTIRLMRLSAPVMLLLSLSSVITAVLYSLQRFTLPAFTIATFNLAIIVVALLRPDHVSSLVWGMILGSIGMIVLQLPALRDARIRFQIDWRHPVVRRILILYAPIVLGLIVNQAGFVIGYNLATRTGDESVTYMSYATTLYQLPLGLVVMGLSTATLPMLSQQANASLVQFKETLAGGLRLVITLILPATAGLFALALPIVQLLFEHGQFTPQNSLITATVLRIDLIGLPFAAIDQMLVYASYARKDTLRPALVGVVSVGVYLVVAISLLSSLGLYGLMVANACKLVFHASIMILLLQRQLNGLRGYGVTAVTIKSIVASIATAGAAYSAYWFLIGLSGDSTFMARMLLVVAPGISGVVVYALAIMLLDIPEAKSLVRLLRR